MAFEVRGFFIRDWGDSNVGYVVIGIPLFVVSVPTVVKLHFVT